MSLKFDSFKSIHGEDALERRVIFEKLIDKKISRPALYLDRDGVIIKDLNYVKNPKDVYLCKGIKNLMKIAFEYNWQIIIITNQSGISKKILTWKDFDSVNNKMMELLGSRHLISGIYANGHKEINNTESWRKPYPGMINTSSKELNIDLSRSILVGDRLSDLKAGANAGIYKLVHVLSGHGKDERDLVTKSIDKRGMFFQGKMKCNIKLINNLHTFPLNYFGG